MEYTDDARSDARAHLSRLGVRGQSVIYTSVRTVASSGMSRTMSVYVVDYTGAIADITASVAVLLGLPTVGRDGWVRVSGVGMDMGWWLVDSLSHALMGATGYLAQRWL